MVYKFQKKIRNQWNRELLADYWRITESSVIVYDTDFKELMQMDLDDLSSQFRIIIRTLGLTKYLEIDEDEFLINIIK